MKKFLLTALLLCPISIGYAQSSLENGLGKQSETIADARIKAEEQAPILTFQEAIVYALANNPTRAQAQANLAAAQARIGIAKSQGGPQIGVNGTLNYDRNFGQPNFGGTGTGTGGTGTGGTGTGTGTGVSTGSGNFFSNNGINQSAGITGQIPIYNGGRVKAGTKAAQALARVSAAQALQVEQDIVYNTAVGYLAVLRNEQLLTVAESDLAVSQERLRVANVRFNAGAAAKLDVLRAINTLADARLRRITAANNVGLAKANLNTQMGREPETPLRLISLETLEAPPESENGKLPEIPLQNLSPQQLRAVAEKNRSTLIAAQEQINAAIANVDVAKAAKKPSLAASLSGILRNPVTFLGRFALSSGLSLAQTLFDSGRAKSQIGEASALLEQAKRSQDVTRQQTAFLLEQQILAVDAAESKLESTDAAIRTAIEALRAAQIGYEAGVRTNVEVSDAQTALLSAKTDAINTRFDLANARAQLASSLGVMSREWQVAYEAQLRQEIARIKQGVESPKQVVNP